MTSIHRPKNGLRPRSYRSSISTPHRYFLKNSIRSRRSFIEKVLLHPTLILSLLIIGVFLGGVSYHVGATEYTVNAVVSAPPLKAPAVIKSPERDQTFQYKSIIVEGSCPSESYVRLYRNGAFSGAAICQNGIFRVLTDLFPGTNRFSAQAFNVTDKPGPASALVSVIYDPPAGTWEHDFLNARTTDFVYDPVQAVQNQSNIQLPLLSAAEYRFQSVRPGESFDATANYVYGEPPFTTRVEWGDDTRKRLPVTQSSSQSVSHTYDKSGYYPIEIAVTDARQRTVSLQLVAYVRTPGDGRALGSVFGATTAQGASGATTMDWLKYAWPTYGVITVMVICYALGERREYILLMKRAAQSHRLRHT